jgi:transcriptional regulator with XRE-family HTH domain
MVRRSGDYRRDMEFAERLRQARIRSGLTRRELADAAGISERAIDEYEGGRIPPKNLPKLARALEVSTVWLLTGEQATDTRLREITERLERIERLLNERLPPAP